MKKHIRIAAVLTALVLLLCSCGSTNNSNNTNNGSSTTPDFDRSAGLDENGYWEGIVASEYVKIPDVSSLKIKQSHIDEHIKELLDTHPNTKEVTDRAIADGDTVNINYVGKIDGTACDGGSANDATVTIGEDKFIDDMLERLVGHKPGETFDMDATFPDPYENNTELSGKKAVFTYTINYIVEYVPAVWNDEFIVNNFENDYGWTTVEDALDGIKSAIAEEVMYDESTFLKASPEKIIQYQIDSALDYYNSYAQSYGIDLNTFFQIFIGYESAEAFKEAYRASAEETAQYYLIYQALAESKGYKVTTEEIKEYFKEMTGSEDYSTYESAFGLPYLKAMIMYENMSNIIRSCATVGEE